MPHVTFIHGLSNKPEAEILHQIWRRALGKGTNGVDLGSEGVTSSMVYWADVLYPAPDPNVADYESVAESKAEDVDGGGNAVIPSGTTEAERRYLEAARRNLTRKSDAEIRAAGAATTTEAEGTKLERIPLPWFIKERIMAAQLRDAYLYLFNKEFSPRPGTSYRVQDEIRNRFISAVKAVPSGSPHVVVSHSMGTMVAYDCLKRVPGCPTIDALVTMGSPLGLDEVQDCFKPEWTKADGFPSGNIRGRWVNVFDHLDVVCGADPRLANDFRSGGVDRIGDVAVTNEGSWRHSVVKYLARDEVRRELRTLLGLSD